MAFATYRVRQLTIDYIIMKKQRREKSRSSYLQQKLNNNIIRDDPYVYYIVTRVGESWIAGTYRCILFYECLAFCEDNNIYELGERALARLKKTKNAHAKPTRMSESDSNRAERWNAQSASAINQVLTAGEKKNFRPRDLLPLDYIRVRITRAIGFTRKK